MDLDTCALNGVATLEEEVESPEVNAMENPRAAKPMLNRDSIRWRNIDAPRSLMVA